MIYYHDNDILIRNLQQSDTQILTEEEIAQGWNIIQGVRYATQTVSSTYRLFSEE